MNSRNPTNIKVNDDGYIMMMVNIKVNIFYGYYIYMVNGLLNGFPARKMGVPQKIAGWFL